MNDGLATRVARRAAELLSIHREKELQRPLGEKVAPAFDGRLVPFPGAILTKAQAQVVLAVNAGIERRAGHLGAYWPELEKIEFGARETLRAYVRNMLVWQACLPRYTDDGRRYA